MNAPLLESYVAGRWYAAPDEGLPIADAVTGETVVRVSSTGLDVPGMLDHARTVGGPALRELTFHQRAGLLKQLGLRLMADKDEFYALSRRTGATDRDSAVDVDGGFGTCCPTPARPGGSCPTTRSCWTDAVGAARQARHLRRPAPLHVHAGRRLQVNAFNFPVWGLPGEAGPGVPGRRPDRGEAGQPDRVPNRGGGPDDRGQRPAAEGSVQLLAGSASGVLDHLAGQDLVFFTGSAATPAEAAQQPRRGRQLGAVQRRGRLAQLLVLGPDATPDTPEFDLFVDQLVTEMTVKAGQKCTAIRRALVPRELVDDVVEATRAKLDEVVVGAPGADGVTMGALASLDQREEVRRSLKALRSVATLVAGDPDDFEVVGADRDRGAFLPPMLLRCDDLAAAEPHDVEAFGPVSTVLPYDGVDHAVELAARGQGSLVGSLVTHDEAVAREFVLGAAHAHGRILVLDRDDARENTGHGSPLPVLVTAGPAGPAAARSSAASAACCTTCSAPPSRPPRHAHRHRRPLGDRGPPADDGVHPFRKSLAELRIGDSVTAGPRR
jgi:oxepin-CoA hydrolase/3-oxo-5,6-dehydrosuberyl-CoA semialdehyde dehydrogenase